MTEQGPATGADVNHEGDTPGLVRCFVSGAMIPREQATRVRLGPNATVWMQADFCRDDEVRRDRL